MNRMETNHGDREANLRFGQRAEWLRQATEIANLGHYVWDVAEDRCVFCSDEHARIHGMTAEEYMTQASTMNGLAHPDDQDAVRQAFRGLRAGQNFELEYRIVVPNGDIRFIREIGQPIFDEDGRVVREIGTSQDITKLKQSEFVLRHAEEFLFEGIEALPVGFAAFNACGELQTFNQNFRNLSVDGGTLIEKGVHFETLLRDTASTASVAFGYDNEEDYIRDRLASVKTGGINWVAKQPNSRWTTVTERPTTSGGFISIIEDVTDQMEADQKADILAEHLQEAMSSARIASWELDREGKLFWSPHVFELFAADPKAFDGTTQIFYDHVHPDDRERVGEGFDYAWNNLVRYTDDHRIVTGDGRELVVRESGEIKRDQNGDPLKIVGTVQDISEFSALEKQLRQSQKLEAVGKLTGGVAHDFNNLLAVIHGCAEFLEADASHDKELVSEILRAARRGADLTHRLLAYARKQSLSPKAFDLADLVSGLKDMLQRTLGETITVVLHSRADLWQVHADPSQVEDALLNMAINARDAMPSGGVLTIKCENVTLSEKTAARNPDITAGDFVVLSVNDSGAGMSEEVRAQAFEPFFTTKDVGEGTGLGLSMIYGFAKQSGGHASIWSEEGKGTTVRLYLPKARSADRRDIANTFDAAPRGKGETILVIEDDPTVRKLVTRTLSTLGYKTIEAEDASSAQRLLDDGHTFELLLSDVVLPGSLSGPQFAHEVREKFPDAKVIFMSGYPADSLGFGGSVPSNITLLNKPFRRDTLAEALRNAIEG